MLICSEDSSRSLYALRARVSLAWNNIPFSACTTRFFMDLLQDGWALSKSGTMNLVGINTCVWVLCGRKFSAPSGKHPGTQWLDPP